MEQIIDLIVVLNFVLLIGLIFFLAAWQKKHGKFAEKKTALVTIGYLSFLIITSLFPLWKVNFKVTVLIEVVLLVIIWGIGYPWARWLYRKFNPPK